MTDTLLLEYFDDLLVTPENAEQLNRTILQLAMQGKLIEQDPNDEPASVLLKKIKGEKAKLLKDGKTRKSKPLPDISEKEILYDLPVGWEWCFLDEVTIIIRGSSPRPIQQYISDHGVNWIKIGDTKNATKYITETEQKITKEGAKKSTYVEVGDIILSNSMSYGKPFIMKINGYIHDGWFLLKLLGNIDVDYFYYLLLSNIVQTQFTDSAEGGVVKNIRSDIVKKTRLPLPPLPEQKRIVARVEEMFAQTRALAKELAHSQSELDGLNKSALSHLLASETPEEFNQHWDFIAEHFDLLFQAPEHVAPLRQSILELALRGKLTRREEGDEHAIELLRQIREEKADLKDGGKLTKAKESNLTKLDEQLYNIPEGWIWCRINDTGASINNAIVDGPFGSNLVLSDYDDHGEYPVITISNIDRGFDLGKLRKINQKKYEELKRSSVYPGDLLVAKIGSSWGKVGTYPLDMPVGIIPANLLKITVNSRLSKDYVRYFLQSKTQRKQLEKLVKFTAQPAFNVTAFKQLLFPLPPLAEQERIVKRVEQLLSLCDALETRLQSAEEERGRLVAAVMSTVGG